MQDFGRQLETVLTHQCYSTWLKSKFKNITPCVAEEIVRFIHDPDKAIEHLTRTRPDRPPRFTPQSSGPTFSTAMAVQVAATYEKNQANDLQDLIETVFATPFCQDEGADGRYGRMLRDLPIPLEDIEENESIPDLRKVEVSIKVPMTLPLPGPNFGEIIQTVRESQSGRTLRTAMTQIGTDGTFLNVGNAWRAVADEIAPMVSHGGKHISVQMIVVPLVKEALWGTLTDFMVHSPVNGHDAIRRMGGPFLRGLSEVGGELWRKLRQADLKRQVITHQLENAVDFNCVGHASVKR